MFYQNSTQNKTLFSFTQIQCSNSLINSLQPDHSLIVKLIVIHFNQTRHKQSERKIPIVIPVQDAEKS